MKRQGGEYCDHCQIGQGCLIYGNHPFACRDYRCIWACGKSQECDRPDRLKIVMDGRMQGFQGMKVMVLNFWEAEEGAINQPRVQLFMQANIEAGFVAVHRPYKGKPVFHFPEGMFSDEEQQLFIDIFEHWHGLTDCDILG
jgi:hypothetical protein